MNKLLQQINALWAKLEAGQKLTVGLVLLAFIAGGIAISYASTRPDLRLLAGDLKPGQVSEIAAYLDSSHIVYRVSDHETAIMVPEKELYRLRNELAQREMLGDGSKGFELLGQTNMWDSTFSEQKNYDRAVAGELERSFREIPGVRSARIIIDRPAPSPFVGDDSAKPRASIKLDLSGSTRLSDKQIAGIIHLTSGAVAGLSPEFVQVMDSAGLLTPAPSDSGAAMAGTALEAENAREMHLARKAQEMLDTLLGPGRSQVKVAVKMDFTKRTEATSIPTGSMPLKETTSSIEENTPVFPTAGLVGTAPNVEGTDTTTASKAENAKKTNEEQHNEYVVGQKTTTQEDELGRITGMTVSILLDHREVKVFKKDDKGQPTKELEKTDFVPIEAIELRKIETMVLNAIGFNSAKGVATKESPQTIDERFKSSIESIRLWRDEAAVIAPLASTSVPLGIPMKDWVGYGIAALVAVIALVIARGQLKKSNAAWQIAEERARRESEERARILRGEGEAGDTRGRRQELKEQIKRSIQADPAAAAAILRKWIHGEQAR